MKRARVTFFMIAYNEEKWIRRAVQSVLDQTEPDIEIYVRNNGSTDRTGEVVREMMEKDSRVHLVENAVNWRKDEAGEIPFATEKGVIDIWPIERETLGDYVSFIDADDRVEAVFVEELLQAAQETQSEITVCGSVFLQDGITPVGQRLPPPLQLKTKGEWTQAMRNHETFVQLYNSFRTYWGKLFRRDFFLEWYDEAWRAIGGKFGAFLDTVVMLRYLLRCESLTCIKRPLYLFTLSQSGSTYSNYMSRLSISKAMQAEGLFDAGVVLLREKAGQTAQNIQFLYQLNWAFCYESMNKLLWAEKVDLNDLDCVIMVLNNKIAAAYLNQNEENIWGQVEPILNKVWEKSGHNLELFLRYPFRLMYMRKLICTNPKSVLLPLLILGILCDHENRNCFGKSYLKDIAQFFPNLDKTIHYQTHMDWDMRNNNYQSAWANRIQYFDETNADVNRLAAQLRQSCEEEQYEEASELLTELSEKSPLHRYAVYYRIFLAELVGEHELAVVLAASARVLFGLDVEMQELCWLVIGRE